MRLALAIALSLAALAAPAQAAGGYRSACGLELSSGTPGTPGGPTCRTDEGDDAVFGGSPDSDTLASFRLE
jgi:hypothetical protein